MTYYDDIAEGYEELHKEEQKKKIGIIKEVMKNVNWKIKESDFVLDVACGTGLTTRPWSGKKTGLDPAKKLLEKARQKDKESTYVLGEAENMPFPDDSFDWVFSITALQNVHDLGKALKEIKRVGKDHFILSFLKKSLKKKEIIEKIKNTFKIIKEVEEEKDLLIFLTR